MESPASLLILQLLFLRLFSVFLLMRTDVMKQMWEPIFIPRVSKTAVLSALLASSIALILLCQYWK